MKELLRTNDPVRLSFIASVLRDSSIESVVFDEHTSLLEGSIGALPRRLMVLDEDYDAAKRLLRDTGQDDS
ncbi:DUF2007 domain-containing protein [Pacificispira sp.]|uniref:putative signal transducing protein n=1 Tax=Pacificispira sp. TaxID=2888761 RepID=UPI003BAA9D8E